MFLLWNNVADIVTSTWRAPGRGGGGGGGPRSYNANLNRFKAPKPGPGRYHPKERGAAYKNTCAHTETETHTNTPHEEMFGLHEVLEMILHAL